LLSWRLLLLFRFALAFEVAGLKRLIAAISRALPSLRVAFAIADRLRRIRFIAARKRCACLTLAHAGRVAATAMLLATAAARVLLTAIFNTRAAIAHLRTLLTSPGMLR